MTGHRLCRLRRLFPLLVGVAAMVALAASPIAADSTEDRDPPVGDQQFLTIDLETVSGVPWADGRRVQARAVVETSRSVSGVLTVVDDPEGGSRTAWEFDLDLAAGSRVEFPITLTTGWNGLSAAATVRSGSTVIGSENLRQNGTGEELTRHVAALGVDDPPRRVAEWATDNQLTVVELDPDLLALENASTMVTTPVAFRELGADSAAGAAIEAWVRGGGQLLVDGPTASLDDRFHRFPTANPDRFTVGAGSIYYDESWRDGVPIGGYVGTAGLAQLVESQGLGSGAGGELAVLADLALPGVGIVAAVLLIYAVLAGPVLFIGAGALGKQRRIWTVLPILALVVAGGILTVGFFDRRNRTDAHITIVEVAANGSRATSNLLLGSDFGGNRELTIPEGWRYLGQARTSGQRPVQLRVGRVTTDVGIEMPPGSNAVIRVAGSAPTYDGLLTIDRIASDGDGLVSAQVTNHADVTLEQAVAFLGNSRTELGDLDPGQTVDVAVAADPGSTSTMRELLIWPRVDVRWGERGQGAAPRDRDAVTAAGAWTEWRIEQGMTAVPENVLGVAAWSDELSTPLDGVDKGRTALFARVNVPDGLSPGTGFSTVTRLPGNNGEPVFDGNFAGRAEDVRITLGAETDPGDLALLVDDQSSAVGLWIGGAWRYLDLPPRGEATIQLPAEAIEDGEVLLRSFRPEWAWGVGSTVRLIPAGAEAERPVLADTIEHRLTEPGVGIEEGFGREGERQYADFEVIEDVTIDPETDDDPFIHTGFLEVRTAASFLVPLDEGQRLVATLRSPDRDSYLELWDADGRVLETNDDFGQRLDSQIVFEAEEADVVNVRVHELGGQAMEYELTLELGE